MSTTQHVRWTNYVAYGFLAAVAAACGSKNSSNDSSAPPEVVSTQVTDSTVNGATATVHYKSNVATARFKCQTSVTGQPAPTDWQDCPTNGTTVALQPGGSTSFRVKAIDPATNVEDQAPPTISLVGQGSGLGAPQGGPGAPQGGFTTVILNKADVVSPYTRSTLVLNFGIQGGAQASMDQITFQCKRESQPQFGPCSPTHGDTYDFGTLVDGQQASLQVQAVNSVTGETAAPAGVNFTVALGGLVVNGTTNASGANLASATTGTFQLSWAASPGNRYQCQVDHQQAADCTAGFALNIDQIGSQYGQGSHALLIQAVGQTGSVVGSTTLNFCSGQCSAATITNGAPVTTTPGQPTPPAPTGPQLLLLGNNWTVNVPVGMHVTEYATTKTSIDQLGFWRIAATSDPSYIGNYACTAPWDARLTFPSPSGAQLNYCNSTPPSDQEYKIITGARIADNHIEVATDYTANQPLSIVDFNAFDSHYEYMQGRSRFEQLCSNRNGAIIVSPAIRIMNGDFWNEAVRGRFYMCTTTLVIPQGGGIPLANPTIWQNVAWVGAFFLETTTLALPQPECLDQNFIIMDPNGGVAKKPTNYVPNLTGCGIYKNPNMLEMTFVSKTPYPAPEYFAQAMQQWLFANLRQAVPVAQPGSIGGP